MGSEVVSSLLVGLHRDDQPEAAYEGIVYLRALMRLPTVFCIVETNAAQYWHLSCRQRTKDSIDCCNLV